MVPGLGGVPDDPHAVHVSLVTEGSGVGVYKEPPVNTKNVDNLSTLVSTVASNLCFEISLTECMQVRWDTLLVDGKLFVEVPNGILPDGSKERFVHIYMLFVLILKRIFVNNCRTFFIARFYHVL